MMVSSHDMTTTNDSIKTAKGIHAFSTAVAERSALNEVPSVGRAPSDYVTEKLENGNTIVRGLRIFKTGTFKDSMGEEGSWTQDDLELIVRHFYHLRSENIFPDVPFRADHSFSVRDVIGYIRELYLDPEDKSFLACDVEFTEDEALRQWNRGTFRSRSAEVGSYETNDGLQYFPILWGVAFVSVPAVEGLHSGRKKKTGHYYMTSPEKEIPMEELLQWISEGKTEESWVEAVNYAKALEDLRESAQQLGLDLDSPTGEGEGESESEDEEENEGEDGDEGEDEPALSNHSKPGTFKFSINGSQTTNFKAVQEYINSLEKFQSETRDGNRRDFVKGLVASNKLPATAEESTIDFCLSLTDQQFESYRKTQEAMPTHSLFGSYGDTSQGTPASTQGALLGVAPAPQSLEDQLSVAQETVKNHQRAGQPADFIKGTSSYKLLSEHNKAPF